MFFVSSHVSPLRASPFFRLINSCSAWTHRSRMCHILVASGLDPGCKYIFIFFSFSSRSGKQKNVCIPSSVIKKEEQGRAKREKYIYQPAHPHLEDKDAHMITLSMILIHKEYSCRVSADAMGLPYLRGVRGPTLMESRSQSRSQSQRRDERAQTCTRTDMYRFTMAWLCRKIKAKIIDDP
jgi:acid stress-induced BolA-like protein IbaG/YrbA